MDGFDTRGDVRIMAATNRVDMLDPALLRPGRFDRAIEIPLPDPAARKEILKIHSRKMHLEDVDLDRIVEMTENTTGAELQAVCREAGMMAVRKEATGVSQDDFEKAVRKVKAEVILDLRMYT
jgi:proteasome regulatory subunit